MELKENEIICSRCKGTGKCEDENIKEKIDWMESYIENQKRIHNGNYKITPLCRKCHGKGKLDWVENTMGVNSNNLVIEIDYLGVKSVTYVDIEFFGEEDET